MKNQKLEILNIIKTTKLKGNVCILGSGPCNDIPVEFLSTEFDSITFIDLNIGETISATKHITNITKCFYYSLNVLDDCLHEKIHIKQFDLVISSLLISQLLIDKQSENVCIIVNNHLGLIVELICSGGEGILSSELTKFIDNSSVDLKEIIASNNYINGLNPYCILGKLEDLGCEKISIHFPWVWMMSPSNYYINYALSFAKEA